MRFGKESKNYFRRKHRRKSKKIRVSSQEYCGDTLSFKIKNSSKRYDEKEIVIPDFPVRRNLLHRLQEVW